MEERYNGWRNYATWRIKLEIFDNAANYDKEVSVEQLKEDVEEAITQYGEIKEPSLAVDYARSFISDVDFYEIADALNQEIKERKEREEE